MITNGVYSNGFHQHDTEETLRILIFAESFPSFTSGVTRRFKEIIRRLAQKRHRIHIITGCSDAQDWVKGHEMLEQYVTFSMLPSTDFTSRLEGACPFLFPNPKIYTAIRDYAPDVIHIAEPTPAALLCGALAKSLNVPIVWSLHTNIDFYLSLYIRSFAVTLARHVFQFIRLRHLLYSTINLSVSQDFADIMESTGVPGPILVWKTGVDSDLFNPSRYSRAMRYRMFGKHTKYTHEEMDAITLFLCVGRLSPEKNFEFLSLVLERIPSQTFLCIIGDGVYINLLEPKFPKDRVHFFGFLEGEELASAYASADYFIYASISETFGQVYLEAMASGTPVIAAKGGQLKEFFVDGEHGYLWEPDNLESAEQAINSAMANRNYLSSKTREQALKFSWDSASNQLHDIYQEAARKHKQDANARKSSGIKHCWDVLCYVVIWFVCMLLALLLMAPFVRVTPPQSNATQKYPKKNQPSSYEKNHNSIMAKETSLA